MFPYLPLQHTTISRLIYPIPSELGSQTSLSLRSTLEADHGENAGAVCFVWTVLVVGPGMQLEHNR